MGKYSHIAADKDIVRRLQVYAKREGFRSAAAALNALLDGVSADEVH